MQRNGSILASSRNHRQEGHGSVLFALVMELGAQLGLRIVVVSATVVSRRFWLAQGLHAMGHLDAHVSQALRALAQSGVRYGRFSDTTQMARSIPVVDAPGGLVAAAIHKGNEKTPVSRGVAPVKAAEMLHYEDLPPGSSSFLVDPLTRARFPLAYEGVASKAIHVAYGKLQAYQVENSASAVGATGGGHTAQFFDQGEPGWAVRSLVPIGPGQVVMEILGELIDDNTFEARPDKRFTVCLDSSSKQRANAAAAAGGAPPTAAYLDLKQAGSVARLVRACSEAPNLEVVVLPASAPPPGSVAPARATRALSGPPPKAPPVAAPFMAPAPVPTPSSAAASNVMAGPALSSLPPSGVNPVAPNLNPALQLPLTSTISSLPVPTQVSSHALDPAPNAVPNGMANTAPSQAMGALPPICGQPGSGPAPVTAPSPAVAAPPPAQTAALPTLAAEGEGRPATQTHAAPDACAVETPAVASTGPSPQQAHSGNGIALADANVKEEPAVPEESVTAERAHDASAASASATAETVLLEVATRASASAAMAAAAAAVAAATQSAEKCAPIAEAPLAPPEGPAPRRAYLVARHFIPAMVELTWEPLNAPKRGGAGGRPPASGQSAAAAGMRGSITSTSSSNGGGAGGGIATRGARCEVRQDDVGLRGAFFGATILSPLRHDGLVQVQYDSLYESVHKDILLTEWLKPEDWNAVRPLPPPPPDGFHKALAPGDAIEVHHESGWWPAIIKAVRGSHHFEVSSDEYVALCRAYASTQVRPRWRWAGIAIGGAGGGWQLQTGRSK